MKHHPSLSPSSFPALQICSHFVSHGEGNPSAQRGDRIHATTEAILKGDEYANLVRDDQDCAQWMADETKELLARVEGYGVEIYITDPETGDEITFGTCDCWGYDDTGSPILIDWKTGQVRDYDAQMKIYALGLMDKLNVDHMHCILIFGDQRQIQRLHVTRADAEGMLNDTLRRKEDPEEPYVKSTYCNRCRRRPMCPAWTDPAEEALAMAGVMDLQVSSGLDVIVQDPAKLGKFIKGWKAISKLVEDHDIYGAAIDFIENGIAVGDYEVRERKGRREYAKDSVQTILKLIVEGDLDEEQASSMFKLDAGEVDRFFKETNKPCPIDTIVKGTYKVLVEKNGK